LEAALSVIEMPDRARRRPTATSTFGVSRRESHDASAFYARFSPPEIADDECISPHATRDKVWVGDATDMDRYGKVADNSVALVVTSPPYFAGKEYEEALGQGTVPASYAEYLDMLFAVFDECKRKLEPGGRIAVNVANLGRKPYRSLSADVIEILERLGLLLRGEIIWVKQQAAGGSCAWGTYQRPGNPVLRDITERIVIASKNRFDRARTPEQRLLERLPNEGSIFMDDFVDATTDVWYIPSESATRVGHPAPFPVELPRRLIDLYTYREDLVLDPFMGSGSTAVAAIRTERFFVGFDTESEYVDRANERIVEERARLQRERDEAHVPLRVVVPPVRPRADEVPDGDFQARAVRQGQKARELALYALKECSFLDIESNVSYSDLGVEVNFRARDAKGDVWLFDVSGAFSSTRPGLKRTDTLWKALGKASVLHEATRHDPKRGDIGPLVLLSTDLPTRNSAGARALRVVNSDDHKGPVYDIIELLNEKGLERLQCYGQRGRRRR
jgi:site-specific DNA-methyltransferase (adenine-specific)